jgi:xylulose-5-phosphate/fructose-6-phosphate phosphoketolase
MHELTGKPLSEQEVADLDAYWRAANYLSAGQIYLLGNPLLIEPLQAEHIKPRLLGHWGTTPGLNMLYTHLNRVIRRRDLDMMYVIGPGHGGPAIAANTWLEGSYSDTYPDVSRDSAGMARLFRQFSFPGGIPSHVAPELPGSIHEGGNDLDRFHLALDVIDRVPGLAQRAADVRQWLVDQRARHHEYILEHGEDLPEIRNWQWRTS